LADSQIERSPDEISSSSADLAMWRFHPAIQAAHLAMLRFGDLAISSSDLAISRSADLVNWRSD